jgi:hypothetical protein
VCGNDISLLTFGRALAEDDDFDVPVVGPTKGLPCPTKGLPCGDNDVHEGCCNAAHADNLSLGSQRNKEPINSQVSGAIALLTTDDSRNFEGRSVVTPDKNQV